MAHAAKLSAMRVLAKAVESATVGGHIGPIFDCTSAADVVTRSTLEFGRDRAPDPRPLGGVRRRGVGVTRQECPTHRRSAAKRVQTTRVGVARQRKGNEKVDAAVSSVLRREGGHPRAAAIKQKREATVSERQALDLAAHMRSKFKSFVKNTGSTELLDHV